MIGPGRDAIWMRETTRHVFRTYNVNGESTRPHRQARGRVARILTGRWLLLMRCARFVSDMGRGRRGGGMQLLMNTTDQRAR